MKPDTPEAPPAPPSVLDEENRREQESVLTRNLRGGYASTILTQGARYGMKTGGPKPRVFGIQ